MMARLDAFVVALLVLGGSMLIENSHRLDTGAPDDAYVAAPVTTACRDETTRDRYALSNQTDGAGSSDDGNSDDGAPETARPCPAD